MKRTLSGMAVLALAVGFACGPKPETQSKAAIEPPANRPIVGMFEPLDTPAGQGAGQPFVAVDSHGSFLLSWTEPVADGNQLRLARFEGGTWTEPVSISERDDFFVNWADFPSVASSGSTLYAHWLQRSAPGTYNYDVVMSISRDAGKTWGEPFVVHDDESKSEHGFVSLLPLPDDRVGIAWLDGRAMAGGHGEGEGDMGLRYAVISPDGKVSDEVLLDPRTCECCTTTLTATSHGPLVAWRDRSETEVRDIAIARSRDGSWSSPSLLHEDGWTIAGCPVNGPQSDSLAERTVIVWYTAASGSGEVKASFSVDGGTTFGPPVVLATGENVVGYVDVVMAAGDKAFAVWMQDEGDRLDIIGREVSSAGVMNDPAVVASTTRGRTGFPRMARSGSEIVLAWNEKGDSPGIRVAHAMISD